MNFKKTAVALAAGMMLSGGVMAQAATATPITIDMSNVSLAVDSDLAITVSESATGGIAGIFDSTDTLKVSSRLTSFADIAAALPSAANVSALAASLNEVNLDGSIVIDGATVSFGAIENVTATANATSSNIESATATARAINGNSLATTVIGAMGTVDLENRVSDAASTDFAAQVIDAAAASVGSLTGLDAGAAESADNVSLALGDIGMVSASVNTGELAGNIAITASNITPTWFLNEATVASVNLTNLDAATTVIGAMNTTNAVNEVMRDVSLKTAVQVIGATTP